VTFDQLKRFSLQHKALAIVILVLASSVILLGSVRLGRHSPPVPTIEVTRGDFLDSIEFHGEMKALKSATISAPADAGDLQIVKLSPEGTTVKPGDVVVEFDKTKTEQDMAQFRSALKSAEAEIAQARAQARLAAEQDRTAVLKARYDVESAKLEASKQEIVSKIEGEEARLKLADSQQALKEAEAKEKSDKTLNDATIESKVQASAKAKFDVERAERALARMTLLAPSAGTITLLQHWAGTNMATYRTGDHAWPGAAIAELPDARTLRVSARVDETERGRLDAKQSVTVQFNSISDRQFTGRIEQIGEIASLDFSGGWPPARNFTLYVALDQSDPRFKPGITGDVKVLVEKVPNAIIIPAQTMFQKSGENVVYVWQRGEFRETRIQVGRKSGDKILVARGLSAGEKLALRDPTAKAQ
jgi:HlyD family secretion protein